MERDKMLLVLTVLEGQHFPRKPSWQLTVEARFDGLTMATDPVDHLASPDFNTDLAWEVDRRGFHVLKIQKTPIKVQCYAQHTKMGAKESVGYIILDLTLAHQLSMKPKWFPILNSKYRTKPELLLSLGLEDDNGEIPNNERVPQQKKDLVMGRSSTKTKAPKMVATEFEDLKAILNEEGKYYQIGPAEKCKDFFTFSVTVGFASNLEQLIPTTFVLPSDGQGFFFYYLLLDNEIYTDPFPDLVEANFAAERATVQLRSSVEAVRAFLCDLSKIQVHLCYDSKSLGSTDVPLTNLLPAKGSEALGQPVTIEDSYELKSSNQSQMMEVPEALKPTVGIVVTLKRDDAVSAVKPIVLNSSVEVVDDRSPETPPSARRNLQYPQSPPQKLEKETVAPDVYVPSLSKGRSSDEDDKLPELPQTPKSEKLLKVSQETSDNESLDGFVTYSFCVDLRTVKNLTVDVPFNCYLRYSYPYFGDVAPILTHPTVDVRHGCSSILPHGYASFDFMTRPKQLDEIFRKNPIKIEVVHKDVMKQRDILIGSSLLHLGHILDEDRSLMVDVNGKSGWRRSLLSTLPVISVESHRKVAEIQLFTALDDFGTSETENVVNMNVQSERQDDEMQMEIQPIPQKALEDRLTEQAAVEIEKWKAWQEASFLKQLKKKEAEHMEAIMNEWTKRETERELLVQKKLSEYQDLEANLNKALANVESRERELVLSNAEGQRMKTDLQLEYERRMQEVKDASRRLKEEFDHKTELERSKNSVLLDECAKLKRQVADLEKRLEVREAEFHAYREQKTRPEIQLQSGINLLNIEKVYREMAELERKISALTKSKVHYKQQYGRCLRELARLKHAMQSEAQAQLEKQKQELEQMKLQILASEKQETLQGQRHVLEELKTEIQRMGSLRNPVADDRTTNGRTYGSGSSNGRPRSTKAGLAMSKIEETQLAHLIEEKDTLLRTGLYTQEDNIIKDLDKQINKILMQL